MHAENLLIHDSCQRKEVHYFGAISPNIHTAILAQTLVIESVHLRDLARFVIASDQGDILRVPNFECEQQEECLHRVEASVDKVAHEQIVGSGAVVAHPEQLHQVVELPVNISTDL